MWCFIMADEIALIFSDIDILDAKILEISESGYKAICAEMKILKQCYESKIILIEKIMRIIENNNLWSKKYLLDIVSLQNYTLNCYEKLKEDKISEYIILFNQRKRHIKTLNRVKSIL